MKCEICDQEIQHEKNCGHHLESGLFGLCLGCFVFTVEMEKWLTRAGIKPHMGNWTRGWLLEILKDHSKHL